MCMKVSTNGRLISRLNLTGASPKKKIGIKESFYMVYLFYTVNCPNKLESDCLTYYVDPTQKLTHSELGLCLQVEKT